MQRSQPMLGMLYSEEPEKYTHKIEAKRNMTFALLPGSGAQCCGHLWQEQNFHMASMGIP